MGGICCKTRRPRSASNSKRSKTEGTRIQKPSAGNLPRDSSSQPLLGTTPDDQVVWSEASSPDEADGQDHCFAGAEVEVKVDLETPAAESYGGEQTQIKKYKETFRTYYPTLCEALPVEQILPELISHRVITFYEKAEILAENTINKRAQALCDHIQKGINAICPEGLKQLLFVMHHSGNHACKTLSEEMCTRLNIPIDDAMLYETNDNNQNTEKFVGTIKSGAKVEAKVVLEPTAAELYSAEQTQIKEYERTFTTYYARLCKALPVEQILPELVSRGVITFYKKEEILAENTFNKKAQALCDDIYSGIKANCPEGLKQLLLVMHHHSGSHTCKTLSEEMCTILNIPVDDASLCSGKPEVSELHRHIVPKYATRWRDLGVQLKIPDYDLDIMAANNANHDSYCQDCCKAMLKKWMELTPNATWSMLQMAIDCLSDSFHNGISHLTYHMNEYQEYLKRKYGMLRLTSPDEMLAHSATQYIDLTIIKGQQESMIGQIQDKSDDTVTLFEALDVEEEEKKCILIEGGPGMGKSTLAINICKLWAKGQLLQSYHAVILLPLREKEIQNAQTLGDLLLTLDDEMRGEVSKEIAMNDGKNICFICEGFDEFPTDLRKSSFVTKLSEKLTQCTFIYTSRPEACSDLRYAATRLIAIGGFNKESIDRYISNTFEDVKDGEKKACELKSQIENSGWIRGILNVPINVAIVCIIFNHFLMLPDTLTQLYKLLALRLNLRHINTRTPNVAQIKRLSSLNKLPPGISEEFSQVCLIAYRGILNKKVIFSSKDLSEMEIGGNITGLGFLLIAPSISVFGGERSYSFLHLTLQEFCAAWYLSELPPEEQLEFFKKFWSDDRLEMVWMFYSGITKLENKEILDIMLSSTNKLVKCDFTYRKTADIVMLLYEAVENDACKIVGDYLEGEIDLFNQKQVSIYALGYFITGYTGKLRLISLRSFPITAKMLGMLIESLKNRSELLLRKEVASSNLILKITLNNNDTLFKSIIELVESYPITELYLNGRCYDVNNVILSQLLHSNNSISVLGIDHTYMDLVKSSDILISSPNHNTLLRDLRLTGCQLTPKIIDEVAKILSQCKSIVSLDLSFNELGDEGIKRLFKHLQNKNTIQHLDLSSNQITAVGVDILMASNPLALTRILLSHNPLRDEGVFLLVQAARNSMDSIEFVNVSMTSSSYQHVANVLHKVRSISFTVCDDSDIIGSSIASATMLEKIELIVLQHSCYKIISGINQNKNIKTVSLSYSCTNDDSFKDIERFVQYNKSITELNISLCDKSCTTFMPDIGGYLTENSSIKHLSIVMEHAHDKNEKSCLMKFLKTIQPNSALQELLLELDGDRFYYPHRSSNYSYLISQDICNWLQEINVLRSPTNPLKACFKLH